MSDKPTKSGKTQPKSTSPAGGKKPYATLDLKAKEVREAKPEATAVMSKSEPSRRADKSKAEPDPAKRETVSKTGASTDAQAKADADTSGTQQTASDGGKPKAEERSTAAPPLQQRSSSQSGSYVGRFFSIVLAAILGGLFALLGADQLAQRLGLDAGGEKTTTAHEDISQRLAALEKNIAARSTGTGNQSGDAVTLFEKRLSELERVREAANRVVDAQAAIDTRAAALEERVKKSEAEGGAADARLQRLEQQLATLSAAGASSNGNLPQLAAITGRLADLEAALDTQTKSLRTSIGREVEDRIGKVAEASEAARSGTARIDRQLAAVQTDAARLGEKLDSLTTTNNKMAGQLDVVQDQTGKLDTSLDSFRKKTESDIAQRVTRSDLKMALAAIEDQLTRLEKRVAAVVRSEQDRKENAKRIVLAIELANLKRRLDRGENFSAELNQVRSISSGTVLDLSALEKHHNEGIPNLDELNSSFRTVAHAVIDAETAPGDDASIVDQLLAGAKSIVRVRRVDHDADDQSAEAIVGRMEAALKAGQLEQVIGEASKLNPQAAEPARDWLEKVEARHAVNTALQKLESQLKASLVEPAKADHTGQGN